MPIHYTTSLGLRRQLRVIYSRASPLNPWLRKFLVRDLVTLTFDLLIFNVYHTWRVTWSTLPPSLKTLRLFFHELRVITFPIDYHWKCVRRPFCFMQIIRWKLKIRLGNRAHCIQHAWIMLESLVSHFYPKMHLTCTILRNASRLAWLNRSDVGSWCELAQKVITPSTLFFCVHVTAP